MTRQWVWYGTHSSSGYEVFKGLLRVFREWECPKSCASLQDGGVGAKANGWEDLIGAAW